MTKKFKLLKDTPAHKAGLICRQGLNSGENSHIIYPLNSINRICETSDITDEWFAPLDFVDENGIDVFKGDNFWIVTDGKLDSHRQSYQTGCKYKFIANGQPSNYNGEKFFSTQEAAQKWIEEMNRSQFQKGDWIHVSGSAGWESLIRFDGYNISNSDFFSVTEDYTIYKTDNRVKVGGYSNKWPVKTTYGAVYAKADVDTIQRILTAVATHKGFKEGVKYKYTGDKAHLTRVHSRVIKGDSFYYNAENDALSNNWYYVYDVKDGWATIVEETPEYVKCINWGGYSHIVGKIYKVNNDMIDCETISVQSTCKPTPTEYLSFKDTHFIPASKAEYDAQFQTKEITITLDGDVVNTSHWGSSVKIVYK